MLPFRPGYRSTSDFAILDFGKDFPPRVSIDTPWGPISTSDKPREVDRFTRRFDVMMAAALPPDETPEFLHRLAREI